MKKNLFPDIHERDRDQHDSFRGGVTAGETKTKVSPSRTTDTTNVVWSNRGSRPMVNEAGSHRYKAPMGIDESSKTYPKLLTRVEMVRSTGSPFDSDADMMYAERTGVGHPIASSEGTMRYQYFEPIENRPSREQNSLRPRNEDFCNEGHSVAPIKGRIDPLGGGVNRYITRPDPQFFRGSGGDMLENLGYCVTRPAPAEQNRGVPLDSMPAPRPPQQVQRERKTVESRPMLKYEIYRSR